MARKKSDNQQKIAEDAIEARKLGLTYGHYVALRDFGYLESFKRHQFHQMVQSQDTKKVASNVLGAQGGLHEGEKYEDDKHI